MTEGWFSETLYPDFRQLLQVDKVLYEGRSGFQHIRIFETPRFGRVLTLDGIVQTTERDEFCYHEMLVHVPLIAHGAAKRMAIIGGGDGGALEEALKHKLEKVILVGDMVTGECKPDSAIELIFVHDTDRPFGRRADFFSYHLDSQVAVDTQVYTPEEFERLKDTLPALYHACRKGRVIYDA